MTFRNDINGLRALAVLPVLFFHSHLYGFEGGFLGVDVFFVISGYLISSIILSDLKLNKFSILSFWDKRLRRIFPALLFICLLTTIISFFIMLPYDLKNYGQSVFASVLSANNILLYLTSGYWSLAAEFKPLYHTWSLAVEDQYYFFIPILFLLFHRKFNLIFIVITLLFLSSFLLSFTSENKELNFLMITHRMWELLAGSLVAIYLTKNNLKANDKLAFLGLSLILLSYFFPYLISNNQAIYTLLPIFGVVLIILYSSNESIVGKILSIKPLMFIGTISYSVYLFHMPLLAFLRLTSEGAVEVYIQTAVVLLSIFFGYISWKYIENTFRYKTIISNRIFYSILISLSIFLLLIGFIFHKTYGLQSISKFNYGTNPQKFSDEPYIYVKKNFITSKPKILIIGNSFARDFINMLKMNLDLNKIELILIPEKEPNLAEVDIKSLLKNADLTISVSSEGMTNEFDKEKTKKLSLNLLNILNTETNGNFYRIGTKNFGFNNNFIVQKNLTKIPQYNTYINKSSLNANELEKNIWKEKYIDFLSIFKDKNNKIPIFTDKGDFISFDTEHVTKNGATFLGKKLINESKLKESLMIYFKK